MKQLLRMFWRISALALFPFRFIVLILHRAKKRRAISKEVNQLLVLIQELDGMALQMAEFDLLLSRQVCRALAEHTSGMVKRDHNATNRVFREIYSAVLNQEGSDLPQTQGELQLALQTLKDATMQLKTLASEPGATDARFANLATKAVEELERGILDADFDGYSATLNELLGLSFNAAFDVTEDQRTRLPKVLGRASISLNDYRALLIQPNRSGDSSTLPDELRENFLFALSRAHQGHFHAILRHFPADGVLPKREAEIQRIFQTVVISMGELKTLASEPAKVDKDFSIRASDAIDEMDRRILAGDFDGFSATLGELISLSLNPAFDISQAMRADILEAGLRSRGMLVDTYKLIGRFASSACERESRESYPLRLANSCCRKVATGGYECVYAASHKSHCTLLDKFRRCALGQSDSCPE